MSVKSDMMAKIEQKAQRIRDKRVEAASNKNVESFVFEFFKNAEHAPMLQDVSAFLLNGALDMLVIKIKTLDPQVKGVVPNFRQGDNAVQGITIHWSPYYIKKNSCEPSLYIDVSQILLMP
jgi:hypothetical protein